MGILAKLFGESKHPNLNPNYKPHGRARWAYAERHYPEQPGRPSETVITIQDRSRWMPHNGKREMARRVRQMGVRRG